MKRILLYLLPKKMKLNIINNIVESNDIISLGYDGTVKTTKLSKYTKDDYESLLTQKDKLSYMQQYIESKPILHFIDKYAAKIVGGVVKIIKIAVTAVCSL